MNKRVCQETEVHVPVFGLSEEGVRANPRLLRRAFDL